MIKHLILILAILVSQAGIARNLLQDLMPSHSPVLQGYHDIDSVKNCISQRPLNSIEGLWQLSGSQAIVVIEPTTSPQLSIPGSNITIYQIVIVTSPRKSVRPGTVLGYFTQSGRDHVYDSYLYTSRIRSALKNYKRYTLSLSSDDHFIAMTPIKSRWHLSLRHSFNFLMRAYVSNNDVESPAPEGLIKLFPVNGKPLTPIYL